MKTFFIEQSKRTGGLKGILKKITKKDNKIIININLKKTKFKTKIKVANKIKDILLVENCKQIVLEEILKNDKQFINLLYGYNINICNPKWLFKRLTNDAIKELMKDKNIEESNIWICANEVDNWLEEYIFKFAKEFKNINIITNHIGKFKTIENKLYDELGILINLSNNKRKSLAKASLILNVDFPKELLYQFIINENAVIINLDENIKIRKRNFKGKTINGYSIDINEKEEVFKFVKENNLDNYDIRDICQVLEKVPKCKIKLKY